VEVILIGNMNEQLDQDVVNLAKSIRKVESADNENARGSSGEFGLYQFMPNTWASTTAKYGLDANDKSRQNQNKAAYMQLKELKDAGHKPSDIAAYWNSGKLKDWENNVGTNSKGVAFDTPAYVQKVGTTYQQIKGGQQQTNIPKSGYTPPPSIHSDPIVNKEKEPEKKESIAEKITRFAGLEKTAETAGSWLARLMVDKDTRQYLEKPTAKETAGALLNVGSMFVGGGAVGAGAKALGGGALRQAAKAGLVGGAKAGGMVGAGQALEENAGAAEIAKKAVTGGAIGGALGVGVPVIGAAAGIVPAAVRATKGLVTRGLEGAESVVARQAQLKTLPKVEQEALRSGLPDPIVNTLKESSPATKSTFYEMLNIHKKGLENPMYARDNKASRVPAQTFLKNVEGIQASSKRIGQEISQIAQSEPGVQKDFSNPIIAFIESLEKKGITLNPGTGKFTSTGKVPSAEMKYYDDILKELQIVTKDSPYITNKQAHELRQRLFQTLDAATRQGGAVGQRPYGVDVDQDVQMLRRGISEMIGPEYQRLAKEYAENEQVLSEIAKIAKTSIDKIDTKDKDLAQILMRTMGNTSARPQELIDKVIQTAQKNGVNIDSDINAQLYMADLLEKLYGSTQTRTLQSGVKQGTSEAIETMLPSAVTGDFTNAIMQGGRALLGKGQNDQIKAFERLINEYAGQNGGLIKLR